MRGILVSEEGVYARYFWSVKGKRKYGVLVGNGRRYQKEKIDRDFAAGVTAGFRE